MKTYARMVDGMAVEIIPPFADAEGVEVPIVERFPPEIVAQLVEYDPANPPKPPAPSALSTAQTIAIYEAALQGVLDAGAQAWGYDSVISAASYAASTNAQFKAEAAALIAWRDAVWVWAAAQLAAIQGGTQAMPTTAAAFIAQMPAQPARPKS